MSRRAALTSSSSILVTEHGGTTSPPANTPSSRRSTGGTPDTSRHEKSPGFAGDGTKAFLFGGLAYDNATYKLDFATRAYSIAIPQDPSMSPAARGEIQNQFVYDSADNLYVLFGGRCYYPARCSYGAMLSDTWIDDPVAKAWTPIAGGRNLLRAIKRRCTSTRPTAWSSL